MIQDKINALRALLIDIDGFYVHFGDDYGYTVMPTHQTTSEIELCRRSIDTRSDLEWLSGFSGSAGGAIITHKEAIVFVDGRYTRQALEECVGFKIRDSLADWCKENPTLKIGFYELRPKPHPSFISFKKNLVHTIRDHRAAIDIDSDIKFSIDQDKIRLVIGKWPAYAMAQLIIDHDNIAWLLNLQSNEIPYVNVVRGFLLLYRDGSIEWFIGNNRLKNICCIDRNDLEKQLMLVKGSILCDMKKAPAFLQSIKASLKDFPDCCYEIKAIKTDAQINMIKQAHQYEAVAIIRLLRWIESELLSSHKVTEMDISYKLEFFREQCDLYVKPSFASIVGSGSNAGIIHYHATTKTNKNIKRLLTEHMYEERIELCNGSDDEILLLDVGGHYTCGTTDMTRTMHFGQPSLYQQKMYTLVLKGHIALAKLKFPSGTKGAVLDGIARQFLWDECYSYPHSTGHGVGFCTNVHEGPYGIGPINNTPITASMVLSNEPGFYNNTFGIRIENLMYSYCCNSDWLAFDQLTMVPYDHKLICENMLTPIEKMFINDYHDFVVSNPFLDSNDKNWLVRRLIQK